jgi:hypothetical protein
MNMDNEEEIPRSLLEAFNDAYTRGQYSSGNLAEFVEVRYLIFKTKWAKGSDRLPPSRSKWLSQIRAVEDATRDV